MSVAKATIDKTTGDLAPGISPIDVSWRNIIFSLRTAAAAIMALALAYWLELSDPQWATLTVFILAQPTVGGALAKGAWRALGTVAGGLIGLVCVALFSQAPELLVASTAALVGLSFYMGARLRNYAGYGALLAGYTTLLVAYEGSVHPLNAWSIAADRTVEILIGIGCGTLASVVILPRYAGDALREAQAKVLAGLASYVVMALHMSTPPAVFARLRGQLVAEVVSFDALCSFALFEAPELRANQAYLARTVREFLVVLSIARGLFVRLDEFADDNAQRVLNRLRPTLESIAAKIELIADDPANWSDTHRIRREISTARIALDQTKEELEAMAGTAPFGQLAEGMLILTRVGDLLHGLAMVAITTATSRETRSATPQGHRRQQRDAQSERESLLIAIRAAVAILLLSGFWVATGWDSGFTALSGGAVMLFFGVKQDNALAGGRTYLIWSSAGILLAYLLMVIVLPYLQTFGALAAVLLIVLLPAGLMAGTPSHAWAGIALGGWTIAEIGFGNVFKPDELAFFNSAAALILGMMGCLAVIAAIPVNSQSRRLQGWRRTIGGIMPTVARGGIVPRHGAKEIVAMLADLLPRLALANRRDEDFFRGMLSMASAAVELGRLRKSISDPVMPRSAKLAIEKFLEQIAAALERLAAASYRREIDLTEIEASVTTLRAELASQELESRAAARPLLEAAASLRFIGDRLELDRAYLECQFSED
jgi:uncharacterized membrane protein YccC